MGILQILSEENDGKIISEQANAGTSLVGIRNDVYETHNNPPDTGDSAIERTSTRPVPTLFGIIGTFKSITTNRYIKCVKQNNWPPFRKRLWQLRYHDRIIGDEDELTVCDSFKQSGEYAYIYRNTAIGSRIIC